MLLPDLVGVKIQPIFISLILFYYIGWRGNINDSSCNMCNRFRAYLGISITLLLFLSLSVSNLSQRTTAQPQLDDNVHYYSLHKTFPKAVMSDTSNNSNPVTSWNQLMTAISLQKEIPAPYLARDYALMHVAIHDALLQPTNEITNNNEKPAEVAIVAGAAAEMLAYLFPENFTSIAALEEQQITHIKGHDNSQVADGNTIGHDVGKKVIEYAKTETTDTQWNETVPSDPGKWSGIDPLGPLFGYQKTYILSSGAEFQPPPPYPFGSVKDLSDVQAVIDAAYARTPDKIAIVHKWGDLAPSTIWNNILNERIKSHNLTIYESARAYAYLHTAMYDSFVSCWYTKFTYWTARPSQRISDPAFTTLIPTPNFPSYTSGHSTPSSTAAIILGQLFPEEATYFLSQAHEAALSRLWAGIHFPQDNNNGFAVGQQIGKKYVSDMLKPPHQFVEYVR
jgi:PAP2 superfamily